MLAKVHSLRCGAVHGTVGVLEEVIIRVLGLAARWRFDMNPDSGLRLLRSRSWASAWGLASRDTWRESSSSGWPGNMSFLGGSKAYRSTSPLIDSLGLERMRLPSKVDVPGVFKTKICGLVSELRLALTGEIFAWSLIEQLKHSTLATSTLSSTLAHLLSLGAPMRVTKVLGCAELKFGRVPHECRTPERHV